MLDAKIIDSLAHAYDDAERERQCIRPSSVVYPGFTKEDAYAVQRRWIELKVARGNQVKGHKIGFTSRAMQRQVGIDEPDYGALMADMFYLTGDDLPMSRFVQPWLECELGFVLGKRLEGPNCTIFDVLNATDYVTPVCEIVDSRTHRLDPETGRQRCVLDNIADNAGNAALIVGGRPIKPTELDLRWVSVLCHRNNTIEETGVAAAVMNHPANGIAWLANKLAPFDIGLEPGQFVLAGSFIGMVEARAGDVFHADFGSLGSISARFV
ncbi:2-oxo-hept-4-ene-1,7-dioate hydratase [Trinickia mobilis]|uniref:2-oxo-hept-4-ene-1,7-dioate hydratase n=1 Tax=Trinickia mobilis TaxID=2816356 RepID=UPI001A8D3E58|nr:2-oxo-hepta-3-ene-1,7-dioic acid hydratase [Trinickia mobilis]